MKQMICAAALVASVLLPTMSSAQTVDVTGEVGWVSEYYYRGIPQATSSASAGLELETAGFYLGSWAADVGDGAEIDLYGGYAVEAAGFDLGLGATGYFYTGDFDATYREANVFAGRGPIEVEFSFGQWDAFEGPSENYTFVGATASHEGLYLSGGIFGGDFEGRYAEAGYDFSIVADLDMRASWIWSDRALSGRGVPDHTLALGITKTFRLLGG